MTRAPRTACWLAAVLAALWIAVPAAARTAKGKTAAELSRPQEWGEAPEDAAPVMPGDKPAAPTAAPSAGGTPTRKLGESETYNRLFAQGTPTPDRDPLGREIAEKIRMLGGERHESQAAVERLALIGPRAVPALCGALHDRFKLTRVGALNALGHIRDRESAAAVETCLSDPAYEVRAEAVKTLGLMRRRESVPRLAERLADPEPRVRRELATALGRIRDEAALGQLAACLRDRSAEVRRQAAQELSAFSEPAAVSALLEATRDPDPKTIGFAARSLGEIGDAAARPRLQELTRHRDRFIQEEARKALQSL